MMRKFAAALLATALIAGPALAQQPAANSGASPGGASAPAAVNKPAKAEVKPAKTVKSVRKHVARHERGKIKTARHMRTLQKHRHHHFAHAGKPVKTDKSAKPAKS